MKYIHETCTYTYIHSSYILFYFEYTHLASGGQGASNRADLVPDAFRVIRVIRAIRVLRVIGVTPC